MVQGHSVIHLLVVCLLAGILGQILSSLLRLPSILEDGRGRLMELEVNDRNVLKRRSANARSRTNVVPVLVHRGGHVELPRSSTCLQPGDRLTVLSREQSDESTRLSLGAMPGAALAREPL